MGKQTQYARKLPTEWQNPSAEILSYFENLLITLWPSRTISHSHDYWPVMAAMVDVMNPNREPKFYDILYGSTFSPSVIAFHFSKNDDARREALAFLYPLFVLFWNEEKAVSRGSLPIGMVVENITKDYGLGHFLELKQTLENMLFEDDEVFRFDKGTEQEAKSLGNRIEKLHDFQFGTQQQRILTDYYLLIAKRQAIGMIDVLMPMILDIIPAALSGDNEQCRLIAELMVDIFACIGYEIYCDSEKAEYNPSIYGYALHQNYAEILTAVLLSDENLLEQLPDETALKLGFIARALANRGADERNRTFKRFIIEHRKRERLLEGQRKAGTTRGNPRINLLRI